jgi:acyl-CoA thioesterase-1
MKRLTNLVFAVLVLFTAAVWLPAAYAGETGLLTVHNKGIGGQNSKQGRARFAKDVVALKPDYVFIYFGLNDTLNEPAFLSEKEYLENLSWMVDQARTAGIKPIVCTIHRVGEEALMKRHKKESYGAEGPNGKIDRYNKALLVLAREKQLPVADFAGVVAAAGADAGKIVSADGVHLTPAGYKALADCFFKVVAAEIKGKATIVCLGDSVTWGAGVKGSGTTTGETYPAYLSQR